MRVALLDVLARGPARLALVLGLLAPAPLASAQTGAPASAGVLPVVTTPASAGSPERISLSVRDVDIGEVMNMLSRKERTNILLAKEVTGTVSINLYDVTLDEAIRSIATAAGFEVERRADMYFVTAPEPKDTEAATPGLILRTFKIQYTAPDVVENILKEYVSKDGKLKALPGRQLILVEDLPEYVARIETLLEQVDKRPKQILIEARILEITLSETETYGIDWKKVITSSPNVKTFGDRGLFTPNATGFFFELVGPKLELFLNALQTRGRVRTLSTPKLLALENQEAAVVIGDRQGYKVTTTINQVTTESIEFLESGVILRVKPSVDDKGRVQMSIHPEVSTGNINAAGIPSQTTTEVTTELIVPDGETIFIGGLIKNSVTENRDSVPLLGDLPGIGVFFSKNTTIGANTETVVLITPHVVGDEFARPDIGVEDPAAGVDRVLRLETTLDTAKRDIDKNVALPVGELPGPTGPPRPDAVESRGR